MAGAWGAAIVCWVFMAAATLLFFQPTPGIDPAAARSELVLLVAETLATLGVGLWLMPRGSAARR